MWSEPSSSDISRFVVDGPRRRGVGEPGDDQGVIALDRDGTLGQDAVLVGDRAADHDDVIGPGEGRVGGRGLGLVGHVGPPFLLPEQVPVFARHRSVERGCPWRRSSGSGAVIVPLGRERPHVFVRCG